MDVYFWWLMEGISCIAFSYPNNTVKYDWNISNTALKKGHIVNLKLKRIKSGGICIDKNGK